MTAMLSGGCGGNDDDHHNHHDSISPSFNFKTDLATAQLFEHCIYVSRELIGDRTSDLPAHSIVPQPTTPPLDYFQLT
jgi:hypothetical protein